MLRLVKLLVLLLVVSALASAAVPVTLHVPGRLVAADGSPVEGVLTVLCSLYESTDAGSPVWFETLDVAVGEGFYAASLGTKTAIDDDILEALVVACWPIVVCVVEHFERANCTNEPRVELVQLHV